MKKLLSVLLIFALIISCADLGLTFAVGNETADGEDVISKGFEEHNVVPENDATFETGTHNWTIQSSGKVQVESNPLGEGNVLSYSGYDVGTTWSSPMINIKDYIQSKITKAGDITIYFKVFSTVSFSATVRIRTTNASDYSMCTSAGKNYCVIGTISAVANKWTAVEVTMPVTAEDLKISGGTWKFCFDGLVEKLNGAKLYIDDFYVGAVSPTYGEFVEIPEKTPVTRSNYTKIGTYRWDAFTKSTPDGTNPASQVAKVLSPAKYHSQAPFFSKVNDDGTVSFPEYTVETWEKEAKYAHDAGLDYFAYLWYDTTSEMSQPRKMHLESANKDLVEMTAILETMRSTETMKEMFTAMKDPVWLRVDNRPVVFLYSLTANWDAEKIQKLRQMAANSGITESLYIIGAYTKYDDVDAAYALDVDALSWYSYGTSIQGWPYDEYADSLESLMANMFNATSEKYNHQVIPSFSFGRDTRARIETGVSWVDGDPNAENDADKPYKNKYSLLPTMSELKEHIATTYNLVQKNPSKTEANLICSYAWNEHEEGGWLCPTLNCDSEGNVILDSEGNYTYNTERVDALKEVLQSLREETYVAPPTADPNATKTVFNGDVESGLKNWGYIHAGSIGYVQPGANDTDNAIRFVPNKSNKYSSVAFNFGGAIINDSQYNYAGCGAGTYTVTFYAKAKEGSGGIFNCVLSSMLHLQVAQVRTLLGYTEGDGNYANDTFFAGGSINMTDQWQKFTVKFNVNDNWLNMLKKIRNSSHAQASKTYDLVLRLDGSGGAYSESVFFDYYIDEVTIKHNSSSIPTPTPEVQQVTTPTPKPTAIPSDKVVDYLEYTVEDNKAVITSVDTTIHGDVTLPEKIDGYDIGAIGAGAFKNAVKLTKIVLPQTVTRIGEHAFEGCFNLENITATGITYIGSHAFCGCENLSGDILIPATTKIINSYAFNGCASLENIEYLGTENKFKENVTVKEGNEGLLVKYTRGDFNGVVLNLGSTLTLDYYISTNADVNDTFMRFTSSSGRVTEVNGVYDEEYKMYKYSYTGINPQCMTDSINAELFHKDGSLLGKHENYSVGLYCERQMNKSAEDLGFGAGQYETFKVLLADVLEYGAEAQKYKNYRLEYLANSPVWVKNYKSTFGVPAGVKEIEGNTDKENRVNSLGVHVANINKVFFKLILSDNAKVFVNDEEISRSQLIYADGIYTYYSPDLKATEFDKVFTIKLVKDGTVLSKVSYNVYAYVQAKHSDEVVGGIAKALFNYGSSAKAYVKAINDPDIDFDLSDDDNLNEPPASGIIDNINSTFEGISSVSKTKWSVMGSDKVSLSLRQEDDNQFLVASISENAATFNTPILNIMPFIKMEGIYTISYKVKVTTREGIESVESPFSRIIRTSGENSFATNHSGNYYIGLSKMNDVEDGVWYTCSETVTILESDLGVAGPWNFGFHQIKVADIAEICIDDFNISGTVIKEEEPISVSYAETWLTNEITLISDKKYEDPYRDVDVNLVLTNGTVTYNIPGFWDGGNIWRARFMCPTAGRWTYTTVCTDTENTGLHNQTNTLLCTEYSGDLELYKRGHVKVEEGIKQFLYDDGMPFFYLADTHWNLGNETLEMVEIIADDRVDKGFSVIQSEPLGSVFKFENGVDLSDIHDLREYDQKFQIIANAGLVHVNASFFYPSSMTTFINNFGGYSDKVMGTATHSTGEYEMYDIADSVKVELERACRYWVARYSAYPVMWSLGQEVDNDFFWNRDTFNGHEQWSYVNNPYHYVAEYISKHDAYSRPLTAHQEGATTVNGVSGSSFRDLDEHDFFAMQWSPSLTNENNNHVFAKDAWLNGQGKPVVNYEGRYCYLWTKNFGARAQGWIAYLGGVYGYAWGGQDTWSYLNTYNESVDSSDGVDTITSAEKKAATWEDSLAYPSAYQVGYMRKFFEGKIDDGNGGYTGLKSGRWWELIPRFDDTSYLKRSTGAYANIASNADNSETVIYFFNFSETSVAEKPNSKSYGTATGKIYSLNNSTTYNYMWFDPISGTVTSTGQFTTSSYSSILGYSLPKKPAGTDYVLYIYK